MITYERFKEIIESINKGEPEIYFLLNDANSIHDEDVYVLVLLKDKLELSFPGNKEVNYYNNLDETPLKDEWENINDIVFDEMFSVTEDRESIENIYNIKF